MASADVVFKLGADVGDALDALKRAEKALEDVGNSTARPAQQVGVLHSQFNEFASAAGGSWKTAIAGIGAAFGGMFAADAIIGQLRAMAGAVVDFTKESIVAAAEGDAAQRKLAGALAASGDSSVESLTRMREAAESLSRSSMLTTEQIMDMEKLGLAYHATAAQSIQLAKAAADMSAELGIDARQAAVMLAQSLDGDAAKLEELIPALAGTSAEAYRSGAAIAAAAAEFRGMAENEAASLQGALEGLQKSWGELKQNFGTGLAEGVQAATDLGTLREMLDEASGAALGFAYIIGQGITEAVSAARTALDALPAMLSSALAGLPGGTALGAMLGTAVKAVPDMAGDALSGFAKVGEVVQKAIDARNAMAARGSVAGRNGGGGSSGEASDLEKITAAVREYGLGSAQAMASVDSLGLAMSDQNAIVDGLAASADGLRKRIISAMQEPGADVVALTNLLHGLDAAAKEAAASGAAFNTPDISGGEAKFKSYDITAMDPSADRSGIGAGLAGAAQVDLRMESEMALMALEQEHYDLQLVIAEQGFATFEQENQLIDLKWQEAEATGEVSAAEARLAAERERGMLAAAKSSEASKARIDAVRASVGMMAGAASQLGAGLMKMALTGEGSFKKMAQAALQSLAMEAAGKAIFELAQAWAMLAIAATPGGQWAAGSAAMHFQAAAVYGIVAGGAGLASAAVGQPGGGGEGGGSRGREFGDGMGTSSRDRATRDAATSGGASGPSIQVSFHGPVTSAGGPEELARLLHTEIRRLQSDTSGRGGPRIL